ncbi:hydroxyisourate hydrolase [Saprolegnia diclina VS20]|uniref:5-hydroxyisourate hydrolase n=1 Tax=Saprolegnia diclina (strain VS20) TaxID=1156394 RepID=T0RW36_SAPDV|nr:hydroxyisourate hydrolase [Saprolegnia diclina VS20]EQC36703.1 hydroxyisourate hydrolase [Saprolegnia diclina VS20]|eukprot:XP_008610124.1 hydroxyisourate hydrolase [Saprolegnia diclina VS20]
MNRLEVIAQHVMPATAPVTSHVLDTSRGRPAADMRVALERETAPGVWAQIGAGVTNADGRVPGLTTPGQDVVGTCRITFYTQAYFEQTNVAEFFYPSVTIVFRVTEIGGHYHVPLLINPFGYSTYRGS